VSTKIVSAIKGACWKAHRARQLHNQLVDLIVEYLASDFFHLEMTADFGSPRMIFRLKERPPYEVPLIVSEIVHHLHSALGQVAFACCSPTPARERDIFFPICRAKENFENARAKLVGIDPIAIEIIEEVQPFNVSEQPKFTDIFSLYETSNFDKHRIAATVISTIDDFAGKVNLIGGGRILSEFSYAGELKDGLEIYGIERGIFEVGDKVSLSVDEMLFDMKFSSTMPDSIKNKSVAESSARMINVVNEILEKFISAYIPQ